MGEKLQLLTLVLNVGGWVIGALVVVTGMRTQIGSLVESIRELRVVVEKEGIRVDDHEQRLGYLEGFNAGMKAAGGGQK